MAGEFDAFMKGQQDAGSGRGAFQQFMLKHAEPTHYYNPETGRNDGRPVEEDVQPEAAAPASPAKHIRAVSPTFAQTSMVGAKSTPEDRYAAVQELHKDDGLKQIHVFSDGSITAQLADGRAVNYPSPPSGGITIPTWLGGDDKTEHLKGLLPSDKDEAKAMAGRVALDSAPGEAGAAAGAAIGSAVPILGTAAGAYGGGIVGGVAAPWVREAINSELPGGSTQSFMSKLGESAVNGLASAVVPVVGARVFRGLRSGANRVASAAGLETTKGGLTTSTEWLAKRAERQAAEKAEKAAGALGIDAAKHEGSDVMADHLEAAAKAGISPVELPPSMAVADAGAVGTGAHEAVAGALKKPAVLHAEKASRQAGARKVEAFSDKAKAQGDSAEAFIRNRGKQLYDDAAAHPDVANLVKNRQDARDVKDWVQYRGANKQLDELADGVPKVPRDPDATNAGGFESSQRAPTPDDAALQEAARAQRAGDAIHVGMKPRASYKAAKENIVSREPKLAKKVDDAFVRRVLADGKVGNLGPKHVEQIKRELGDTGKDILQVDRLAKTIRAKAPAAEPDPSFGVFGALAHPALATKMALGKTALMASRLFGKQRHLNKVLADPKLRAHLFELMAHGRQADPTDHHTARTVLTGIAALMHEADDGKPDDDEPVE